MFVFSPVPHKCYGEPLCLPSAQTTFSFFFCDQDPPQESLFLVHCLLPPLPRATLSPQPSLSRLVSSFPCHLCIVRLWYGRGNLLGPPVAKLARGSKDQCFEIFLPSFPLNPVLTSPLIRGATRYSLPAHSFIFGGTSWRAGAHSCFIQTLFPPFNLLVRRLPPSL